MVAYIANQIGCEINEEVLIAGIGNESIGYVMFQRGTTPETNCEDPPYFEYDDQLNGGTNLIETVELTQKHLIICTTKFSLNKGKFEITLDLETKEIKELASQLIKIFKGYENMLQINIA